MAEDNDIWIFDPSQLEDKCVVVRSKTAYIYCYPVVPEVLVTGAKVITRTGKTVKKVQRLQDGYEGFVDGEECHWDLAGRFSGPYKNDPLDIFIPERFFRKDWQAHIKMGNAEWTLKFGRTHPTKKM